MKLFIAAAAALALSTPALAQHAGHDAHAGHGAPAKAAAVVQGTGVVKSIDLRAGTFTIAHDPIKALNWGAMTMPLKVADAALLKSVAVGDKVVFDLKGQQIVAIRKR